MCENIVPTTNMNNLSNKVYQNKWLLFELATAVVVVQSNLNQFVEFIKTTRIIKTRENKFFISLTVHCISEVGSLFKSRLWWGLQLIILDIDRCAFLLVPKLCFAYSNSRRQFDWNGERQRPQAERVHYLIAFEPVLTSMAPSIEAPNTISLTTTTTDKACIERKLKYQPSLLCPRVVYQFRMSAN